MRPRRRARTLGPVGLVLAVLVYGGGHTFADFRSQANNAGNRVQAAPDFVAPTVQDSVIAKTAGGSEGYVRQAGLYHVYANVSDTGNPPSGIALVTADVSNVTAGLVAAPLVAGSYSVGGTSYSHRSGALTAGPALAEGPASYTVSTLDNDSNGGTEGGFSVVVDNTEPFASDVQVADGGGTVGQAEAGDTITYTFSEPVEPGSIVSGWDGSPTGVVVRLVNGGLLGDDEALVYDAEDLALPLGTLDLNRSDYVGGLLGGEVARFGASGTPSTMTMSGSTITVTLGSHSGQGALTAGGDATAAWTPSALPTDRAGNPSSLAGASETGADDREF